MKNRALAGAALALGRRSGQRRMIEKTDSVSNAAASQEVSAVLAHGAWADGSSWARVITALKAEAVKAVAAPLPLTSLVDDVAALNRSLDRTEGPIVVAGHAYAGAVIALARPERAGLRIRSEEGREGRGRRS